MKKAITNINGFVLPLVLVVVALLAGGIGYLLTKGIDELHANTRNREYAICVLTGKNALETVKAELEDNIDYVGTNGKVYDENGGAYGISVYKTAENIRYVTVISEYHGFQKKFEGQLELEPKENMLPKGLISKFSWRMMEGV